MINKLTVIGLVGLTFLLGCTKDIKNLPTPPPSPTSVATLVVNEYVSSGSLQTNEYGTSSDWMEIYNPNETPYTIPADSVFITNDSTAKDKFALVQQTISPHGFLLIWCDALNKTTPVQIHSSFKLTAAGSFIGIYKKTSTGAFNQLDGFAYPDQSTYAGASQGRWPDGSATWKKFTTPTPGVSNN